VSLEIGLLGTPSIAIDGVPQQPPRGKKAWGLLAYLLLAAPAPRERLAGLLFAEADDPLGALRWNLSEIRRVLRLPQQLRGNVPALILPPDAVVDVRVLSTGSWIAAIELANLGRELLEGVDVRASVAFETWLDSERRHVQAQTEAVLHEAALARLTSGDGDAAISLAARLVAIDPLDENAQELLIRTHAAVGDREATARQLAACVELFRRELGVEPGPAVYSAAEATATTATATPITGPAAARAQLDAGRAAIAAGAVDAGLESLRRGAAEAHACGDVALKAETLLALGSALAHAARGRDEEASAALHEAIALAERVGDAVQVAAARRELAWIDVLRERYSRALNWIDAAAAGGPAPFDEGLRAAVAYQQGRYAEAIAGFERALRDLEDPRTITLVVGELGLIHAFLGDLLRARRELGSALAQARSLAWNTYLPLPEALLGIVDLAEGSIEAARERLEHAFALSCQIRDCCWEGIAAVGLASLDVHDDRPEQALGRFEDAVHRSVREPDAWLWGHAFVLDHACTFAVRERAPVAARWVGDLEALAARTMMRDFLARAYLYRFALGDPDALRSAELVASDVDDPILHARIREARTEATASGGTRPERRRRSSGVS
jgi:DNA-binding SARP family transcriptional activator